jgi:hypothetical protein
MLVIRSILGTTKTLAFIVLVVIMATKCGRQYGMLAALEGFAEDLPGF